jgi:hypothetical protein
MLFSEWVLNDAQTQACGVDTHHGAAEDDQDERGSGSTIIPVPIPVSIEAAPIEGQ